MYRIQKTPDRWTIENLDSELKRSLTADEIEILQEAIPELGDPMTASYYTDEIDCLEDKP